jgi:pilus assembly protein Flp/PilA
LTSSESDEAGAQRPPRQPTEGVGDVDRGATATEYALLIAMVVIMLVAALVTFGNSVTDLFQALADKVAGWATSLT